MSSDKSKKQGILEDLARGMKNVEISEKYNVNPSYVSHIIKEQEILKKIETLDKILAIIKKDAIEAYEDKLTEEEREFWRDL